MIPQLLSAALLAASCLHAGPILQAYGELPSSARDSRGETIGGLGSAVAYDPKIDRFFMMPDRGAGDGTIDYRPRCYRLRITPDAADSRQLEACVEETILFRDQNGRPFTGLLPDGKGRAFRGDRRCLDPEALAIAPDGTFYVSDEYAPALLQFDRSGRLLREIPLPDWLQPRNRQGAVDYRSGGRIVSGRDENRGAEALGILPGGKRAILILQSALVQDGGRPAGTARILELDLRSGKPVAEYAFAFGPSTVPDRDLSVNDLAVVDGHRFLVLERDGFGRSGAIEHAPARTKAVWLVDTRHATNLLRLPGRPYDQFPAHPLFKPLSRAANVRFVRKTLLFNLPDLLPQLDFPLRKLAAKWEGLALLPPRSKRAFHLLMTADNDFLDPVLHFGGRTIRFPRARDAVPTQFFELLAPAP